MKYSQEQLELLYEAHEVSGPRGAYYANFGHHPAPGNQGTCAVEDFIFDFYKQYNANAGRSVF